MSRKVISTPEKAKKCYKMENTGIVGDILDALEAGANLGDAARAGGISPDTLTDWTKQEDFREKVESAQARWRAKNVGIIQTAADKDWKAAAWLLERRCSELYGRQDKIKMENVSPPSKIIVEIVE